MYALIIQIVIALIQALIQYFANSDLPPAQRNKIALTTFGTSVLGFMASNYMTTGSVMGAKIGGDGASKMAADAIGAKSDKFSAPPNTAGVQNKDNTGVHTNPPVNDGSEANGTSSNGGGRQEKSGKPAIANNGTGADHKEQKISKVMGAGIFDTIVKAGMAAGDNLTHVIDAVAPHTAEIIDATNKRKIINETSKAINNDKLIGIAVMLGLAFIIFRS